MYIPANFFHLKDTINEWGNINLGGTKYFFASCILPHHLRPRRRPVDLFYLKYLQCSIVGEHPTKQPFSALFSIVKLRKSCYPKRCRETNWTYFPLWRNMCLPYVCGWIPSWWSCLGKAWDCSHQCWGSHPRTTQLFIYFSFQPKIIILIPSSSHNMYPK